MTCTPSDQSLLKRDNYSSGEIDKSITKIQTGEISQVKSVCGYGILRCTLEINSNKKIDNVEDKRPSQNPFLGEAAEKDLVQWFHVMQK